LSKLFSPRFRSIKEYLFFRLILITIILNPLNNFLFIFFALSFRCLYYVFFLIILNVFLNLNSYFLLGLRQSIKLWLIKIIVMNMINYKITAWRHETLVVWFVIFSRKAAPIHFLLADLIHIIYSLLLQINCFIIALYTIFVPFRTNVIIIRVYIAGEMFEFIGNSIIFLKLCLYVFLVILLSNCFITFLWVIGILGKYWYFFKSQCIFLLLSSTCMVINIETLNMLINIILWSPIFLVHNWLIVAILLFLFFIITL